MRRKRSSTTAWIRPTLDRLRDEAEAELAELGEQIEAINNAIQTRRRRLRPAWPSSTRSRTSVGVQPMPLLDSSWSFAEQCKRLIDSKAYRIGGDHR